MTTRQPTTNDDYGGGKWPSSIYLFKQQEQKQKRNMKKEKIINWTFISLRIYCDTHQNGGKGGYKAVERASGDDGGGRRGGDFGARLLLLLSNRKT